MEIAEEFIDAVEENNINKVRDMIRTAGASASQLVHSKYGTNRWCSLHWAAYKKRVDILNMLLDVSNVDINIRDYDDYTPIHNASVNNSLEALVVLVQRGGDIHLRNKDGDTAVQRAHSYAPRTRIIDYLVSQGATHV